MLHCAASKGCLELVDWLLDNIFKETPSVKNDLGETPLHLAAAYFTKGTYILHLVIKYLLVISTPIKVTFIFY
jgi:ankyrin repeat protein